MEENKHILIDIPESDLDFSNDSWKEVVKRDFQEIRNALEKNPNNGSPAYYTWFLFFLKYGKAICSEEGKKYIKEHNTSVFNMIRDAVGLEMTSGGAYTVGYKFYDECIRNSKDINAAGISIQKQNNISLIIPKFDELDSLQKIFFGAPGTGKSYTIDCVTNENNSVRTTFHPDSDYAGFVGAYKPTMAPMPINAFVGTTVHHAKNAENEKAYEKKIVYKFVPQAFLKAYVEAWKRYAVGEPYYLIIEEINRGNCAQIFGDLFQLLDRNNTGSSSYAISADEDIAQFLRYDKKGFAKLTDEQSAAIKDFVLKKDSGSEELIGPSILDGSKLLLPPNLYIWATMNTSDQSLFPIDSAFKRRWNWEYMPIEYDKKDWTFVVGDKRYRWGDFLKEINPKIFKLTMSEDKQMGYFFAKPDKKSRKGLQENDTISAKVFVNKVLFYLWTDVFKDYDLTEEPFVYEDSEGKKMAYRFTDFFPIEGNDMLNRFVEGFGLEETAIEEGLEDPDDIDNPESADRDKKSPNRTFRIRMADGTVISSKRAMDALIEFVRYAGIEKVWELNIRSHKNPETAPEGIKFISKSIDSGFENWNKRYKTPIPGTEYFINIAWSVDDMIKKLIKPISEQLGLKIVSTEIIPQSEYDTDEAAY